jgi:hypothetical protein
VTVAPVVLERVPHAAPEQVLPIIVQDTGRVPGKGELTLTACPASIAIAVAERLEPMPAYPPLPHPVKATQALNSRTQSAIAPFVAIVFPKEVLLLISLRAGWFPSNLVILAIPVKRSDTLPVTSFPTQRRKKLKATKSAEACCWDSNHRNLFLAG